MLAAHFAGQFGIMQATRIAQSSGTIWPSSPLWCFGTIAAMASSRWSSTASFPGLVVAASKATHDFVVFAVVTCTVIVSVHGSVTGILWCFHQAGLVMVENDIPHALKRHLDSLALLQHLVDFLQPRHRLWRHADALIVVRPLAVVLGKFCNASRPVSHLVERGLNVKAFEMALDRLAIRSQTRAPNLLLFQASHFGAVLP